MMPKSRVRYERSQFMKVTGFGRECTLYMAMDHGPWSIMISHMTGHGLPHACDLPLDQGLGQALSLHFCLHAGLLVHLDIRLSIMYWKCAMA
jgi:hypothetical protein